MKNFDLFIKERKVKKITVDKELAKSLCKSVKTREDSIMRLPVDNFALIIFENMYDCMRELLDALLALNGYKSYSHEASIVYLKKLNFPDRTIFELDRFRQKRNNSKYYGKIPTVEDAQEIKRFYSSQKEIILKEIKKQS